MKSVFVASSRKFYDDVFKLKDELERTGIKGYYRYTDETDIEDDFE